MNTPDKLTMEERETVYSINPINGTVTAYSTVLGDINTLKRLNWKLVQEQYYKDGSIASATFEVLKRYLTPRKYAPRKVLSK